MSLEKKILVSFGMAIAFLALTAALLVWFARQNADSDKWLLHTQDVLNTIAETQRDIENVEASAHRFLISQNGNFLEKYRKGIVVVKRHVDEIKELTVDNPIQQNRIPTLLALINHTVDIFDAQIEIRLKKGPEAIALEVARGEGEASVEKTLETIRDLASEERQLFSTRLAASQTSAQRMMVVGALMAIIAFLTTGVALSATLRGIKERKRANDVLRESEERVHLAVTAANLGTWHWNISTGDLRFSEKGLAIFDIPPETVMSYERFIKALHPDDRERTDLAVRSALESKSDYRTEYRAVWQDGSIHWISAMGRGFYDARGIATRMQGVLLDVTERKLAEVALLESEERFRRALMDSPFPMLLHAEDGMILQASQSLSDISGYTMNEIKTIADWTERAYGERKATVQADIEALYELEHRKYQGDYTIHTKSGATRIWEFSSAPLGRLSDGRRIVISMATDVTERREAEAKVRQLNAELERRVLDRTAQLDAANKELEAFSYSVSHDLRAPLRSVDSFSLIVLEDYGRVLDAEGKRLLNIIRSEAQRMAKLVDDLLAFSRMGRQGIKSLRAT